HGVPILANAYQAVEAGLMLRFVYSKIREWFDQKNAQINEQNESQGDDDLPVCSELVEPSITLPRGAIAALVLAEIVERVGYQQDLEIDVQPLMLSDFDWKGHPNFLTKY